MIKPIDINKLTRCNRNYEDFWKALGVAMNMLIEEHNALLKAHKRHMEETLQPGCKWIPTEPWDSLWNKQQDPNV